VPAAHATGEEAVLAHEKPRGHVVQDVAPKPAYVPATQTVGLLVPVLGHSLPAGHCVQLDTPDVLYSPALQS